MFWLFGCSKLHPIPSDIGRNTSYLLFYVPRVDEIGAHEKIDDTEGKTAEEVEEMSKEQEAKARAQILEMVSNFIPRLNVQRITTCCCAEQRYHQIYRRISN